MKKFGILVMLVGGLALPAMAQTSMPALPPLPAVPSAPSPGGMPSLTLGKNNTLTTAPVNSSTPATATTDTANTATPPSGSLPSLPPLPGSSETGSTAAASSLPPITAQNQPANGAATNALPGLPPLPGQNASAIPTLPGIGGIEASPNNLSMSGLPTMPLTIPTDAPSLPGETTSLPEIKVVRDKPKLKSWETVLEPSIIPPVTKFNYHRDVSTIFRKEYDRENQHLPKLMTRDDYAYLLFKSVAKNDVEATRALLNAGTPINVHNVNGETPLAFAEHTGAMDVAALLKARGGSQ